MGARGAGAGALCLVVAAIAAGPAQAAETHSFSNTTPIATDTFLGTAGPMLPYPSAIAVADVAGTITDANVTLHLIAHGDIDEIDALVLGPGGQDAMVLSDACDPGQNTTLNPLTFTFDDGAASAVPASPPCTSGTFRPTNYQVDGSGLHAPAPPPPPDGYPTALSAFNGTSPNGLWQLFVYDDAISNTGTVSGGWTLELTTTGAPPAATPAPKPKKKCKKHKKRSASTAKKRCKKKR